MVFLIKGPTETGRQFKKSLAMQVQILRWHGDCAMKVLCLFMSLNLRAWHQTGTGTEAHKSYIYNIHSHAHTHKDTHTHRHTEIHTHKSDLLALYADSRVHVFQITLKRVFICVYKY